MNKKKKSHKISQAHVTSIYTKLYHLVPFGTYLTVPSNNEDQVLNNSFLINGQAMHPHFVRLEFNILKKHL